MNNLCNHLWGLVKYKVFYRFVTFFNLYKKQLANPRCYYISQTDYTENTRIIFEGEGDKGGEVENSSN